VDDINDFEDQYAPSAASLFANGWKIPSSYFLPEACSHSYFLSIQKQDFIKALDLTSDRINTHIARRQQEGAKNATINRELAALKRMFSLAVQAGKLSSKPYIPTLEENNARQGFLDHGSFLVLRENLPVHLKDPVTFLYHSGWRVSEMRALEWRDVALAGHVIRLRPEISKNKDGRVLPIKAGELFEIIERAKQNRLLSCPYVFHQEGQRIGDFGKAWKTACKAAGFNQIIVHDLRRSAVRNMVRAGIPERVAMSLSGHKTRSVFDRYNIVSESDLAIASERLQAHLEEQPRVPVVVPIIIAPSKTTR
jgi:integrase